MTAPKFAQLGQKELAWIERTVASRGPTRPLEVARMLGCAIPKASDAMAKLAARKVLECVTGRVGEKHVDFYRIPGDERPVGRPRAETRTRKPNFDMQEVCARILVFVQANGPSSIQALIEATDTNDPAVRRALRMLIDDGKVECRHGARNKRRCDFFCVVGDERPAGDGSVEALPKDRQPLTPAQQAAARILAAAQRRGAVRRYDGMQSA